MKKAMIKSMLVLSLIAMVLTAYLTYLHYQPMSDSPCDFNKKINCSSINKSSYSGFFHAIGIESVFYALGFDIPVAVLGFIMYFVIGILLYYLYKHEELLPGYVSEKYIKAVFAISSVGFLFSAYLTYVEAFVLYTWCMFCVMQAIIITIILIMSILLLKRK